MKKGGIPLLDKAKRSLFAVKLLLDQGYPEFAMSRVYYAMFYMAEALLMSQGLSYRTHGGVIGAFGVNSLKRVAGGNVKGCGENKWK